MKNATEKKDLFLFVFAGLPIAYEEN